MATSSRKSKDHLSLVVSSPDPMEDSVSLPKSKKSKQHEVSPFVLSSSTAKATRETLIREWYAKLSANGLVLRTNQVDLSISVCESFLSGSRLAVEAPTGTGKTIAYLIGALAAARCGGPADPDAPPPAGKETGPRDTLIVVATATIALQNQIVDGDLPKLVKAGILYESEYASIKGRGRYFCINSAEMLLSKKSTRQLDLYDDGANDQVSVVESAQEYYSQFMDNQWDGELDNFKGVPTNWNAVSANVETCVGKNKCEFSENCPFLKSRERMNLVNLVITNQDFVLADLLMDDANKTPLFANKYYCVFDEAHHLPAKAQKAGTSSLDLNALLEFWPKVLPLIKQWDKSPELRRLVATGKIEDLSSVLVTEDGLRKTEQLIAIVAELCFNQELPLTLAPTIYQDNTTFYTALTSITLTLEFFMEGLRKVAGVLKDIDLTDSKNKDFLQTVPDLLLQVSYLIASTNDFLNGFSVFVEPDITEEEYQTVAVKRARGDLNIEPRRSGLKWISTSYATDGFVLNRAPLDKGIGDLLNRILWDKADRVHAVMLSATLQDTSGFDRFRGRVGILPTDSSFVKKAYPHVFPYKDHTLYLVKMENTPKHNTRVKFTEELKEILPSFIDPEEGTLILFPTKAMQREIAPILHDKFKGLVRVQGEQGIAQLISSHKTAIDEGRGSILCGTDTLAEGLDLPGKYCTHVVICAFPFAAANTPVEVEMQNELKEEYFRKRLLPDAFVKLVQMVGRLIRKETDVGRITLFDSRLRADWGKEVLNKLPPFKRKFVDASEGHTTWSTSSVKPKAVK